MAWSARVSHMDIQVKSKDFVRSSTASNPLPTQSAGRTGVQRVGSIRTISQNAVLHARLMTVKSASQVIDTSLQNTERLPCKFPK